MNSETKSCQNCRNSFTIEPEDFDFYAKIKVPAPTFCPECRFQRRLSFRNNRVFYKRECGLCGKSILSSYNPNKPFIIYCRDCWLSDQWNPINYGRAYDFSTPFFKQFRSLQTRVPRANLYQTNFIASEYCNYGLDFKNCYLLFGGYNNERVYFGNQIFDSHDSFDIGFSEKIEFSYDVFECKRVNNLFFSHHSEDCVESYYLIDCKNCINCFGCVGLRNKQYCVFNEQYTKEKYQEFINSNNLDSYRTHLETVKKLKELDSKQIHRYARVYKSVNSDGDDLSEARNTHMAFTSSDTEDSKYLFFIRNNVKDCYDTSFQGFNSERVYEIAHGFGGSNAAFGVRNHDNQDSRYNEECRDCSNIFGCEGLQKKQYCILNKQYSKEEYEELVPKIIQHMNDMPYQDVGGKVYKYGEFFPPELSPFAYNESIAQEYYPLTKEGAIDNHYDWKDADPRNYQITLENENIPDNIKDLDEGITKQVVGCQHAGRCAEQCTEAFKILPEEFEFYKKFRLPLPRLCPNCRHYQRLKQRNPLKLWSRQCQCGGEKSDSNNYQNTGKHFHGTERCPNNFKTSYATERPEIVYCEQCYQSEVV